MKRIKYLIVMLLILTVIGISGLVGCDDDSAEPEESKTYKVRFYVVYTGSDWTYYDRTVREGGYLSEVYNIPYGTSGLTFMNWYLDKYYEMIWNPTTPINTNISLYAQYKNFKKTCDI